MTDFWNSFANRLFERDLDDIQIFADYYIGSDSIGSIIIKAIEKKGITINNHELLLSLAIWEYNALVNSHLYLKAGIRDLYLVAVKNRTIGFCNENKMPLELFYEIESVYHWKATRQLAADYSAPMSLSYNLKSTKNENKGSCGNQSPKIAEPNNVNSEVVVFDNYWDVCTPLETHINSIGLFLKGVTKTSFTIVDKEFIARIEDANTGHDFVKIIENNLRRNLVEVFFCSIINDKETAKLVFEAFEDFVPRTFNHEVELIIAPLIAIHSFCLEGLNYLYPMQMVKHEFSPDGNIVFQDLMNEIKSGSMQIRGTLVSLVEQWSKWRGIAAPSEDLCNLIFATVLGLQGGRKADSEYFSKKISDNNCRAFVETVIKLGQICSSIDQGIIESYLKDRDVNYGFKGYVNEDGLLSVSGPPRDINTMICDLDIPINSVTRQADIDEKVPTETTIQATAVHANTHNGDKHYIIKRAETWPLPSDFFETDYIDTTCNEGDYIPGFLSGIVDFSLIGTDITGNAMKKGAILSSYFTELINALASKGCFNNDNETKLAFAHALTGRRIKQGVKWKESTYWKWTNVMCYLTWRLYGGKYNYISKVFPELSGKQLGKSYADNLNDKNDKKRIKEVIDVFLNKVIYLYSEKQEIDNQELEQLSTPK